ncbi:hydroxysqualene dehydroxylase [Nocardia sp. CA-128927]|uniref:hydroxysqualene dehydroxylase n=1 Tax=Nocardia sp. CA-128927 TaxID=3239975 RepID=UPI003D965394
MSIDFTALTPNIGLNRRQVLRGVTALGTTLLATPGQRRAHPAFEAVPRGRRVGVFGGGMAGLSAAHELVERGYEVVVYEPVALGGKSRSIGVLGTGSGGRADLPGEHGFRFFPGCYQHVPDTMARIPFPGNVNGVAGNLVRVRAGTWGFDGLPPVSTPAEPEGIGELTPETIRNAILTTCTLVPEVPPSEMAFFAGRLMMWFTMSTERRLGQWEYLSWLDAVQANGKSAAYRNYLARAATRITVAAKPETSSARTILTIGEAIILTATGLVPQYQGGVDRVLNAPTNEAWIEPWVTYLRSCGVRFVPGAGLTRLRLQNGQITGAIAGDRWVDTDWYVCAMPAERVADVLDDAVLEADPRLAGIGELVVDWMTGVQFYLRRPIPVPAGHLAALGTPWALTALCQAPMWRGDFAARYGDGTVAECLSVDVSDWDTPGIIFGKPAKACTRDEVAQEVWAQLKRWFNTGTDWLHDDNIVSWHIDPGIHFDPEASRNDTPLLVNTIGSWDHRPEAACAIPNLFFCGDYIRTNINLATMEGAIEAGRRAANAILDAAGDTAARAAIFQLYAPPMLEPLKRIDAERYRAGLPHLWDT